MCEMLQYVIQKGKTEGRAEGMKEGIKEGMKMIARNLSELGFDVREAARLCNVPLDMMREWYTEWVVES